MERIRLTHDEDGVLRRLTFFMQQGMSLSPEFRQIRAELRARDYRAIVRDPWERGVTRTA